VNRKHITQQMIKEFTPLLGYIPWSSFQWIFCIICSKCSKMCFTMLKMPNRWLNWLQNVQKPLAGLFRHLVWPKIEEDRLLGSSPSNLLSLDRQIAPFFLPVCHFEQNAISLAPDVRLNPNELRWIHNDETYAPIRFEAILSTLNFEQNSIPWITPPHWKAFGPPKYYFQSI
jgi:hypothetical protein